MAKKKYRVGVIGFAHMHVNTLIDEFSATGQVEWVACCDLPPAVPSLSREPGTRWANLKRAVDFTGIPKVYEDYREMLTEEAFDIIIVCCENARHAEVVTAAAAAGANIVVEKPMATSYEEALAMARAAQHHGVALAVNWPSTWRANARMVQKLVSQGEVGDVWKFKYMNIKSLGPLEHGQKVSPYEKSQEWWHQAAQGGGAYFDYCSYGANLSRWYLGRPAVSVDGLKANFLSHYGDADDNGVLLVRFPDAVAILEGSWTTWNQGFPNGPIVYGSKGILVCSSWDNTVYIYDNRSDTPRTFDSGSLPEDRNTIAKEFMHHLETGEPLHPTLDLPVNLDAMAILDAGLRAAQSGKAELVKTKHWS